jgi:hypothetical protein
MQEPPRERESIWSVPVGWQDYFWSLFALQFSACVGLITWYEVSHSAGRHPVEIFIAIGRGILPFIPVIVAQTVIIVEVMVMISERYLARRYRQGRTEGLAEGRAEGLTEGRAEGQAEGRTEGQAEGRTEAMAEAQTRLDAWNRLRLEAQERGEVFNQPPPSFVTPGLGDKGSERR